MDIDFSVLHCYLVTKTHLVIAIKQRLFFVDNKLIYFANSSSQRWFPRDTKLIDNMFVLISTYKNCSHLL